jgi:hypothetical protein
VRVTDSGRDRYRSWLTRQLPDDTIRIPVLLAVSFGSVLDPHELKELLGRNRDAHRERLAEYEQLHADLAPLQDDDPWARATVSFGIAYERAVLDWFTTLPPSVRPGPD